MDKYAGTYGPNGFVPAPNGRFFLAALWATQAINAGMDEERVQYWGHLGFNC